VLIASAGTSGGPAPGAAADGLALATRQVRTNLIGVINTVEPLLPSFRARGRGRIAMVASIAGYRGLPYSPAYSASKAGVRVYGEALRALLAPSGVAVTVVCPGFFVSPMTDRFKGPTPFLVPLDRAAAMVKRGVDRGRARVAFPWPLVLGLRLADLIPAPLGDAIMRGFRFHIVSG
jgi:NAD(P)-dependent dehydrogenase (short-subunit alcohol dehydrogenase family)